MADLWYDHKRSFTAGEVGEILNEKVDFTRYVNGCNELLNMVVLPQGPVTRREGFKYVYDLTSLDPDTSVRPREIPFVFSKTQAYVLVFFTHTSGLTRVCFLTKDGLVEDPTPGSPYVYEFTGTMDYLEMDYAQSNDVLYLTQPNRTVVTFSRLAHNSWSAVEPSFTSAPTGTSGWSAPDNWPTKVAFYEQRICYAATKNRPQTTWFSASALFTTMTTGSAAADAVTLTFNSGEQNVIEWLVPSRALIVGTLGDEWTVSGKGLEPLSFESFSMIRHTNQGTESIKPILIGPVIIFVERLGRVVNQFVYNYATDSYDVVDLSVLAPHLTDLNKITSWAYQKTPGGVVWSVRDDGAIIALTMKREHDVIGWHRHTTQGSFLDVCTIPGDNETDVFVVTEREIDGDTKWYLEVKAPQVFSEEPSEARYLDCFLTYEGVETTTITGADHLEGEAVTVLVNGKVYPTTPVVTGGDITLDAGTLDATDNVVVVGFPYTSRVVPTPGVVPHKDGASSGRMHELQGCNVSIYRSSGFSVGVQDMLKREDVRHVSLRKASHNTNDAVPLFTGYVYVDLPATSADPASASIKRIVIEQDNPLPLTVLGLVDRIYTPE